MYVKIDGLEMTAYFSRAEGKWSDKIHGKTIDECIKLAKLVALSMEAELIQYYFFGYFNSRTNEQWRIVTPYKNEGTAINIII